MCDHCWRIADPGVGVLNVRHASTVNLQAPCLCGTFGQMLTLATGRFLATPIANTSRAEDQQMALIVSLLPEVS
jgi:hypothetical protein